MYCYHYCTLQELMAASKELQPQAVTLWPNAKGVPRADTTQVPHQPVEPVEVALDDIQSRPAEQQTYYFINGRSFGQGTFVRF